MQQILWFKENKTIIYITEVFYGKDGDSDNEKIKFVTYYIWDEIQYMFIEHNNINVEVIAKMIKSGYECFTGKKGQGQCLLNAVGVTAIEQSDGDYHIRTKPDDTKLDNYSYLKLAKEYNYATEINPKQ